MDLIKTISDKDIFPTSDKPIDIKNWEIRNAVKVVILDHENRIALVGTKYQLLPGGGVEKNEHYTEAAKREALEEVGCTVEITSELGLVIEIKEKVHRKQNTFCYLTKLVGEKRTPTTTQLNEQGIKVFWYSLDKAIETLNEEIQTIPYESYHSCFNVRNNLLFLEKLRKDLT